MTQSNPLWELSGQGPSLDLMSQILLGTQDPQDLSTIMIYPIQPNVTIA